MGNAAVHMFAVLSVNLSDISSVCSAHAVTPHWARFNVGKSSKALTVGEATKLPILSTVAESAKGRRVIIYRISQSAMTSGQSASQSWSLRVSHVNKWSNPLMGWVSSADTLSSTQMNYAFESAEQAILFAVRNGWEYEVNPGATGIKVPGRVDNQYQYNFLSREVSAQMRALGPRKARAIFANPEGGKAAWVNWRRTPFGTEPWKPADYQTQSAWTGPDWPAPKPMAGSH